MLNVAFTRGFVSSQAFVDRYGKDAIKTLLPSKGGSGGLDFTPTHPKANRKRSRGWGSRRAAQSHAVLEQGRRRPDRGGSRGRLRLERARDRVAMTRGAHGTRLKVIIDDEGSHGKSGILGDQGREALAVSAGRRT